jgi:hypothetical protein
VVEGFCPTPHYKTHSTAAGDEVTVAYGWHPWAGRSVRLHEVIERATGASARCGLVDAPPARLQEIPLWMLDAATCRTARPTLQPVVALSALAALHVLLSDAARGVTPEAPAGAAVASPESRGDRHATPSSPDPQAAPATRPRPDERISDPDRSAGLVRPTGTDTAGAHRPPDPPPRGARQHRRSGAGHPIRERGR